MNVVTERLRTDNMLPIDQELLQYVDCINGRCHGCGEIQHVHVFHFSDERIATLAGTGTLILQLCNKCCDDSRDTYKGHLINVALIPRVTDQPAYIYN